MAEETPNQRPADKAAGEGSPAGKLKSERIRKDKNMCENALGGTYNMTTGECKKRGGAAE